GGKVLGVTLEIPLGTFALGRLVERYDPYDARIRALDDALDGPALAGGVAPLDKHAHLDALLAHPFLQLHELTLQWLQLAEIRASCEGANRASLCHAALPARRTSELSAHDSRARTIAFHRLSGGSRASCNCTRN